MNTILFKSLGVFLALGTTLLSGCAYFTDPRPGDPRYAPTYPTPKVKGPNYNTGSIYRPTTRFSLYEDRKATRVGDILTIRLEEKTEASKEAETKTNKKSKLVVTDPTVMGSTVKFPVGYLPLTTNNGNLAFDLRSESDFQGKGESDQSNSLKGTISVTIADVLPNGYLVVQGETWVKLNRGKEYVRITGIVRPDDVDSNNTVSSTRVANARIAYSGTGQVAESNISGWLTRFFGKFWPF